MSEQRIDSAAEAATGSDVRSEVEAGLSGPGAGLGATGGKTADTFRPGDPTAGTTYGDPGGTGTAGEEIATEGMSNAVETTAAGEAQSSA